MFGDLTVEEFLRDYWQQKPLLIRQAFPNFISPLSPDELAGLACETDTARIVLEKGGKQPWEVRHGPFDEDEFAHLPDSHWTLLVNDTDQFLPELKAVLEPFRFLPDWRIDDLMISFAVEGGSVGPHIDEYDVFLIQAQGKRRWQINQQAPDKQNFLPDLELRIMRDFQVEQEWVLEPGDMLYLPPNVPHYGVALDQCMTYSVGFRAPTQADMLEKLVDDLLDEPRLRQRFSDQARELQTHPGELMANDRDKLIDFIVDALPQDLNALQTWLGKYLTTLKNDNNLIDEDCLKYKQIEKALKQKFKLTKSLNSRLLYIINEDEINLYANGIEYKISADCLDFVRFLCKMPNIAQSQIAHYLTHNACLNLLIDLIDSNVFQLQKR